MATIIPSTTSPSRVSKRAPFLVFQLNYSIDLQTYYMQQSTWVDNMVDKYNTSYLYQKRGVYYFSKQVVCDIRQHYYRDKIVICLRAKSSLKAMRSCQSLLTVISSLIQSSSEVGSATRSDRYKIVFGTFLYFS